MSSDTIRVLSGLLSGEEAQHKLAAALDKHLINLQQSSCIRSA